MKQHRTAQAVIDRLQATLDALIVAEIKKAQPSDRRAVVTALKGALKK